jgi:hypothetical protein
VKEKMTIGNEDKDKPNKGKYSRNSFREIAIEKPHLLSKKIRDAKKTVNLRMK